MKNTQEYKNLIQSGETEKRGVWVNIFDSKWNTIKVLEAVSKGHKIAGQISIIAGSLNDNEDSITGGLRETGEEVGLKGLKINENCIIKEHSGKILLNVLDDNGKLVNQVMSSIITIILDEEKPELKIDNEELLSAERVPASELQALLEDPLLNGEIRPGSRHAFLRPEDIVSLTLRNGKYAK